MATYSTDLTTLNTTDSTGTYTEFASPYNGGGTPDFSGEQYIQGVDCVSQNTGKAVGLEISCVYDHGSGYSFSAGDVIFMWMFYFAGTNLESYANSGWRLAIGSSTSAWDWFRVGGNDYGSHKYGGWFNFAVDPTATETGTVGGGNGGTYRYFGNVPYTQNEVNKGDPVAIDAIRAGRGVISITGAGGSFSELAQYNDYNDGGTPPGTSSTSVDSGYHVLGLFQAAGGSYLWKGLLSLGTTGASVTFSDSNETIIIDDCPHTYPSFNKVEINNASSSVSLTNITFISTATTANGVGYFEMVDNATTSMDGCSFVSMGTFIFQSNASVLGCSFVGCNNITAGGGTFTGSKVLLSSVAADGYALTWDETTDPDGNLDSMTFSKGTNDHHAIYFGDTIPTSITLRDIAFGTGFSASNNQNSSTLYFADTSGTITVNLVGCTGNISYKSAGADIDLVIDPVTLEIEVTDIDTQTTVSGVTILIEVADGTNFPYQDPVTISGTGFTAWVVHSGHGLSTNDYVVTRGVTNDDDYNGVHQITVLDADQYIYTTDESIGSSPAEGTPIITFAPIFGFTDPDGLISDTRTWANNQLITGKARKADASPYYKQQPITGEIDNTAGLSIGIQLIRDE